MSNSLPSITGGASWSAKADEVELKELKEPKAT